MEHEKYIDQKRKMYEELILFIDDDSLNQENFNKLIQIIKIQNTLNDIEDFGLFINLLATIITNHHRDSFFFSKIEKIISEFKDKIKSSFSNTELFNIFKKDKRILLFLFEENIITIDENIFDLIRTISFIKQETCQQEFDDFDNYYDKEEEEEFIDIMNSYMYYFYPEIKNFLSKEEKESIEKKLFIEGESMNDFEKKRKIGENDSYICQLIRQDSVVDFIQYINRNKISCLSKITTSIYETNFIFNSKNPSLIEYAAFCGSIQIFRYLMFNKVELKPSLWIYAIHSKNADLIHFLEENKVEPPDQTYEICFKESVKCHHNDIAQYVYNNLIDDEMKNNNLQSNFKDNILSYCFHYYNFGILPDDKLNNQFVFLYLCKYNYFNLVKLYLNEKEIDINLIIILIYNFN